MARGVEPLAIRAYRARRREGREDTGLTLVFLHPRCAGVTTCHFDATDS